MPPTTSLRFPAENDPSIGDMNLFTTFAFAPYSTWATYRTPGSVYARASKQIVLPYPNNFNTLNNILYTNSPSIQIRGVEEVMKNLGGIKIDEKGSKKGGEGAGTISNAIASLGKLAAQNVIAAGELAESFMTGGNVFRADHTETVLKPGCRRTHVFEFTLVAKTPQSAKNAADIALMFQTKAHPGAFTRSIYTMNHPDIWIFSIGPDIGKTQRYWDGQGLTSVLSRVDINRSPIQNIPYYIDAGSGTGIIPMAINIKLLFTELEPAFAVNDTDLQVRSAKDL